MRNFDLIKKKIKKKIHPSWPLPPQKKKVANSFTEGGRGTPMVMPRPYPCGSK